MTGSEEGGIRLSISPAVSVVCVYVCMCTRVCETGGGILFRTNWPNFAKLCIKEIVVTDANMTYRLIS